MYIDIHFSQLSTIHFLFEKSKFCYNLNITSIKVEKRGGKMKNYDFTFVLVAEEVREIEVDVVAKADSPTL